MQITAPTANKEIVGPLMVAMRSLFFRRGPAAVLLYALSVFTVTACAPHARDDAAKSAPAGVETALKSLQARAEQGDAVAQYELGWAYREGWGVPQDWEQVYFWSSLAASASQRVSDNAAISRNFAAFHLTQDQIAALKKRLADWKPIER
ncbi:MAG TPA: hypothetical protein VEW69_05990 [Alphaproteobacteria bacterium]|nr:hypothetical protein [Alphaproteobacteria bacterium]